MAEYIEREAALADFELYETQVVKNEYALAIAGCRSHIRKLPAADVRPVVRGKWGQTKDEFGIYNKCSACGKEYYCGPIAPFNFCPNCGADMREES